MLKLFGGLVLACGACAWGLAAFGMWPVQAGVGVSLMCSAVAWTLVPWWAREDQTSVASVSLDIQTPRPIVLPEVIVPAKKGSVAPFMAERLTRSEGAQVAILELFEAYHVWCRAKGLATLDAAAFAERLGTICATAHIQRGGGQSLINVALAH